VIAKFWQPHSGDCAKWTGEEAYKELEDRGMMAHSRKFLLLAALCWIAPASAEQRSLHTHEGPCPTTASVAVGVSSFPGEMSLFDFGAGAPSLLP
jgi:hypothetical protein